MGMLRGGREKIESGKGIIVREIGKAERLMKAKGCRLLVSARCKRTNFKEI